MCLCKSCAVDGCRFCSHHEQIFLADFLDAAWAFFNAKNSIHHQTRFKSLNTVVVLGGLLDGFLYSFHVHFVILLINFILT